jgi:hypothetical protein
MWSWFSKANHADHKMRTKDTKTEIGFPIILLNAICFFFAPDVG